MSSHSDGFVNVVTTYIHFFPKSHGQGDSFLFFLDLLIQLDVDNERLKWTFPSSNFSCDFVE